MELVWDDKQQKYVLQYVANTEQRSIFDKDFQEEMNGGSDQETLPDDDNEADNAGYDYEDPEAPEE